GTSKRGTPSTPPQLVGNRASCAAGRILVHQQQGNRRFVVVPRLAVGVRQPREPPKHHADGRVVALVFRAFLSLAHQARAAADQPGLAFERFAGVAAFSGRQRRRLLARARRDAAWALRTSDGISSPEGFGKTDRLPRKADR